MTKKLAFRTAITLVGATLINFMACVVAAMILNRMYWEVPMSYVYSLSRDAFYSFVGYCAFVIHLAGYAAAGIMVYKDFNEFKKEKEVEI